MPCPEPVCQPRRARAAHSEHVPSVREFGLGHVQQSLMRCFSSRWQDRPGTAGQSRARAETSPAPGGVRTGLEESRESPFSCLFLVLCKTISLHGNGNLWSKYCIF